MKMKGPLLMCLAIAALGFILLTSAMPAQAFFDPQFGYAAEVVLNKDGIDYDLEKLEGREDVNVIVVEDYYDDGDSYGDDAEGVAVKEKTSSTEEESTETEPKEPAEPDDTTPPEMNYLWDPGTYYIYQSHYDEELAVVLREVEDTYYTEEEDQIVVQGLSIVVAIQIKWEIVNYTWETKSLTIPQEVTVTQDMLDSMEALGWTGYYEDDLVFGMMLLEKDGASVFISTGEGGKTPDGPSEGGDTSI
jgi:hypothetical protein